MRVLYYSPTLLSPGGGGSHARGLREAFARLGHEVCALPEGSVRSPERAPETSWLPEYLKVLGREARARVRHRHANDVLAAAAGFSPEIAVVRRATYDLTCDALVRRLACPIVAEVNAVLAYEADTWGEQIPDWEAARERAFLWKARRVCPISDEVARDVTRVGIQADRIVVVENGVDDVMFSPDTPVDSAAADWSATRSYVIGYSGSVGALHDIETLTLAAEQVLAKVPGAGFLWIGVSKDDLSRFGTQRVVAASRCTGPVDHRVVARSLAVSDVCWGAFKYGYGSPLKVYEYAALARPTVIAAEGMPARVVEASAAGIAVARADSDALAEAVVGLLGDPERRVALGQRGREWVESGHTWMHVARAMIEGVVE